MTEGPSAALDELRRRSAGPEPPFDHERELRAGDVVEIPYAVGRAIIGLVLYGERPPSKLVGHDGTMIVPARRPGLGACLALLDLDATDLHDLDRLRVTPWLLPPTHPGPGLHGWARRARVALVPDVRVLPVFETWERGSTRIYREAPRDAGWSRTLRDYAEAEVTLTPAVEERKAMAACGGFCDSTLHIRVKRGLCGEVPWIRSHVWSAAADRTPFVTAAYPPFVEARPPRPRRAPAPREPEEGTRVELAAALERAIRECTGAWQSCWDRNPHVHELASGLRAVLMASPEECVADPGRLTDSDESAAPAAPPRAPRSFAGHTLVQREHEGGITEYQLRRDKDTAVVLVSSSTEGRLVVDAVSGLRRAETLEIVRDRVLPARAPGLAAPTRVLLRSIELDQDPLETEL